MMLYANLTERLRATCYSRILLSRRRNGERETIAAYYVRIQARENEAMGIMYQDCMQDSKISRSKIKYQLVDPSVSRSPPASGLYKHDIATNAAAALLRHTGLSSQSSNEGT